MKSKLKILSFNKGALVDYYQSNPDDLYAPTHIFPNIDPEPSAHYNEYKSWSEDDKLYKDHWISPYTLGQFESMNHVHFNGEEQFAGLLEKEVVIEHFNNSDDINNVGNIIRQAKLEANDVVVIFHRLHSYIVPYSMWNTMYKEDVNVVIDNAFEAESYSMHRLFYWLHALFGKVDFVKYLYAAHDIPFMEDGKMSRKNLIKQEFGIDMINVEFFMLHELTGNKDASDNDERNKLIYKNYDPTLFQTNNKPLKFICLNNYMKDHRLYIVNYLVQNDLIDKGIMSARFSLDPDKPFYNHGVTDFGSAETVNKTLEPFGQSLTRDEYSKLKDTLPIIIDDDLIDNKHAVNSDMFNSEGHENYEFRDRWVNWQWYANTDFTIVNESSFTPSLVSQEGIFKQYLVDHSNQTYYNNAAPTDIGFLTEKTFKPIMYGHPFILATHPGALERLRQLGFETYPDWFNENYDNEGNDEKRIQMICTEIKKACENELDINLIRDKLEYNRHHFFAVENAVNIFNNLFDDMLRRDK